MPREAVYVPAFCGLRWDEVIALRLVVADNAVQPGIDHTVGQTKGRKIRSVSVSTSVLDELSPRCAGKVADGLVLTGWAPTDQNTASGA